MRPSRHLALSTAAGGAVWAATGEPLALPITVGAGVLVDLDHAPDLWWYLALGRKPVAMSFLHGWEWLAGLVVLGIWSGFPWWLAAILVGYGLHLLTDHTFNRGRPLSYSLIYRAIHRFDMARVSPEWRHTDAHETLQKELPFALWLINWWRARSARSVAVRTDWSEQRKQIQAGQMWESDDA